MSTLYNNTTVLEEQLLSYVKFETLPVITKENLQENILLPESKYQWAFQMLKEVNNYKNETIYLEVIAIQALIMKAFLLRVDNKLTKKEKILRLIEFCLIDLNIYMENELYLCSMYLNEDSMVLEYK